MSTDARQYIGSFVYRDIVARTRRGSIGTTLAWGTQAASGSCGFGYPGNLGLEPIYIGLLWKNGKLRRNRGANVKAWYNDGRTQMYSPVAALPEWLDFARQAQ